MDATTANEFGQYRGIKGAITRTIGGVTYLTAIYGNYMGEPNMHGIVVIDATNQTVVCDRIEYRDPDAQATTLKMLHEVSDEVFTSFVKGHPEYRAGTMP